MPELSDSNDSESLKTQLQDVNLEVAKAQLKKLNLEIEDLKAKSKWQEGIVRYIPLITAVLTIVGFVWGVYLFISQQERDRRTRVEDRISRDQMQYRTSYDQLLQFSTNPNMTVQRVLFLRDDINQLIDSLYPPNADEKSTRDENSEKKDELKRYLFSLITKECDFTQTKHVRLDIEALQAWKDYEQDLKKNPNKIFIRKYIQAIAYLHIRDPKYIESVTYDPEIGYKEYQPPTEPLSNSFGSLVEGFRLHLQLLGKKERDEAVQEFNSVTNNPTLTADLFAPDPGNVIQ